jgi:hypothetical protein
MATLTYLDVNTTMSIEAELKFDIASGDIQRFLSLLNTLHGAGGLQSYKVTLDTDFYKMRINPLDVGIDYRYVDSQWEEKFKQSSWINARIVGLIRPVTEAVLAILLPYQITKIEVTWA